MSKSQTATETPVVAAMVATKAFASELEWVNRFAESKGSLPIIQNVLLSKSGSTLTLTATDLEVAGVTQVSSSEGADFTVAVSVRKLLKYLAEVDDEWLSLSIGDHNLLRVKHGADAVVEIHGMSAESFPVLPAPVLEGALSGLRVAVPRAITSISVEESRFTLNYAMLEVSGTAQLVSTDGHRLSICEIGFLDVANCRKLIPLGCLKQLAALGEDAYHFGYDEGHVFFLSQVSMRRIVSRSGKFPDYERVMPQSLPHSCPMGVDAMAKAVKRAMIFADSRSRACRFELADSHMEVSAQLAEEGGAKIRIAADWANGPYAVGFSGRYVRDFLGLCPPDSQFHFKFDTPDKAHEFSTAGWRYLLMPLRM